MCSISVCVCVCFWVCVPSKQDCEFINVWILKRLTPCKQSRCFNEFLNILISALVFLQIKKEQEKRNELLLFPQVKWVLTAENVDCPLWDIYSLIFFLSGKWLLLMWVRNKTFLWRSFLSLLLIMCACLSTKSLNLGGRELRKKNSSFRSNGRGTGKGCWKEGGSLDDQTGAQLRCPVMSFALKGVVWGEPGAGL